MARLRRPLGLLPFISFSLGIASAQSFVGGDLSTQRGPYGLPASTLANAAGAPFAYNTFPITGYNTSIPAGSTGATGSDNAVSGWNLAIGVSADVSLGNANDDAIDTDDFIEVTTLYLAPPAVLGRPAYNRTNWRLCVIVFPGGLSGGGGAKKDGSCGPLLPEGCISELQARSVTISGTADDGGCADIAVPSSCEGHFSVVEGEVYGECVFHLLLCIFSVAPPALWPWKTCKIAS